MAVGVLLDTNAYAQIMRGREEVAAVVRRAEEVLLSAVVAGESLYGFRRGSQFDRHVAALRSFLDRPYVSFVAVGPVTADRYGRIAAALRAKGRPIPANDIWIAAHAMETGAEVVAFGHSTSKDIREVADRYIDIAAYVPELCESK